jgi:hypothetical protein
MDAQQEDTTNGAAREDVTIALSVPIQAHGEELDALVFRPLRVDDFERVGFPVRLGADGSMEPIADRISKLISRLAGIPPSSVAQLAIPDWFRAMEAVVGFFGPSARTS